MIRSESEDDLQRTSEDYCGTVKAVVSGPRLMTDNDLSEYTTMAFQQEFESELEEVFFGEVEYQPNRRPQRIVAVVEASGTYRSYHLSQGSSPSSCVCPDTALSDPKVSLRPQNRDSDKNPFHAVDLFDPNGSHFLNPSEGNLDPFL